MTLRCIALLVACCASCTDPDWTYRARDAGHGSEPLSMMDDASDVLALDAPLEDQPSSDHADEALLDGASPRDAATDVDANDTGVPDGASAMDVASEAEVFDASSPDGGAMLDAVDVLDAPRDLGLDARPDAPDCATGSAACGGRCVSLQTDTSNCGGGGTSCDRPHATSQCSAGRCEFVRCAVGFGDCDGDASNGCETDLRTSTDHCGVCGRACRLPNASPRCDSGCQIAACTEGFGDCDGSVLNGCEADLRSNVARCGACTFACALGAGSTCAAARCTRPSTRWVREPGSGGTTDEFGLAVDRAGNAYVLGRLRGTVTFGRDVLVTVGVENGYLASVSPTGEARWARRFGYEASIFTSAVATTAAGLVVIVGSSQGPVDFGGGMVGPGGFLAIYEASGMHRSSRTWTNLYPSRVAAGDDGNLYLAGTFSGTVDLGDGPLVAGAPSACFAASLAADGTLRWSRALSQLASVRAIVADASGNAYVVGPTTGSIGLALASLGPGGADRWSRTLLSPSERLDVSAMVRLPSDGSLVLAGTGYGTINLNGTLSLNARGATLVSLSASGSVRWGRYYSRDGVDEGSNATGLAVDPSGDLVFAGVFTNSIDLGGGVLRPPTPSTTGVETAFVATLSPDGTHRWSQRLGRERVRRPLVAVDPSGEVTLSTVSGSGIETDVGSVRDTSGDHTLLVRLRP